MHLESTTARPDVNAMDTLYYDGNCPLCLREIRALEKLRDERLQLVDVHLFEPAPGEPTRESMLLRLHLKTADGMWLSGVDATVKAWSHTRWGIFFRPLRWPLLASLSDRAYDYWARRRFDGLYCGSACRIRPETTMQRPERDSC